MIALPEQDERCGLLSASGFERTHGEEGCPASFLLEKNLKEQGPKTAAKRGDKIHAALEGKIPMSSLNHSDKICAERLAFHEAKMVEELGFEGATIFLEERYWVRRPDGKKAFSAKSDAVHVLSDRLLVLNYKTGHYPVTPIKENLQMKAEALAAAFAGNFLFKTCSTLLIHPNYALEDGSVTQHETAPIEELKLLLEPFRATAALVLKPDAPFRPGKACTWCLGRKQKCCPAIF